MRHTVDIRPGVNRALLYAGYGCFLATFSGGPFDTGQIAGWEPSLLIVLGFYGGLAAACLGMRLLGARGVPTNLSPILAPIAYAAVSLLGLVLQWSLGYLGSAVLVACSAVMGCASCIPLLFWYERLFSVYRREGRMRFIVLQAGGLVISIGSLFVVVVLSTFFSWASVIVYALEILGCMACQIACSHSDQEAHEGMLPVGRGERAYFLTPHSSAVLVGIGFAWGLVGGAYSHSASACASDAGWPYIASVAAALLCSIFLVHKVGSGDMRFGTLVRLIVTVTGAVLAAMPLVQRFAPDAVLPVCQVLFVLDETSIVLFTVDICREQGYPVVKVLPVNFSVFAAAACLGGLAFWFVMSMIGGQVAWECFALLGAAAAVMQVPFLPSRSSDAAVFTLKELPENESYELFIARRRKEVAAKYSLTPRESDVLECLLRNMTRQQIADEMHLSEWTVRDRIRSIYKKIGVGSYKEFIGAIEGDGR